MPEPKLKPCPFCGTTGDGGDGVVIRDNPYIGAGTAVVCKRCHAKGPVAYFKANDARDSAAAAWNKRVGEEIDDGR